MTPILISLAVLWPLVVVAVIAACRAAQRGDAALRADQRAGTSIRTNASNEPLPSTFMRGSSSIGVVADGR